MVCHFRFVFTVECLIFPHSLMNNRLYDHIAFHLIQKIFIIEKGNKILCRNLVELKVCFVVKIYIFLVENYETGNFIDCLCSETCTIKSPKQN